MVCGWQDDEWGGEVLQAGNGEEGEKWGSFKCGPIESVKSKYTDQTVIQRGQGHCLELLSTCMALMHT